LKVVLSNTLCMLVYLPPYSIQFQFRSAKNVRSLRKNKKKQIEKKKQKVITTVKVKTDVAEPFIFAEKRPTSTQWHTAFFYGPHERVRGPRR